MTVEQMINELKQRTNADLSQYSDEEIITMYELSNIKFPIREVNKNELIEWLINYDSEVISDNELLWVFEDVYKLGEKK